METEVKDRAKTAKAGAVMSQHQYAQVPGGMAYQQPPQAVHQPAVHHHQQQTGFAPAPEYK